MASLTVRQLDERLKKLLRLRAAKSGRSVEDEVRTILREAAEQTGIETLDKLLFAADWGMPAVCQDVSTINRQTGDPDEANDGEYKYDENLSSTSTMNCLHNGLLRRCSESDSVHQ